MGPHCVQKSVAVRTFFILFGSVLPLENFINTLYNKDISEKGWGYDLTAA